MLLYVEVLHIQRVFFNELPTRLDCISHEDRENLVSLAGTDPATNTTKADFTAADGALYWGLLKLADLKPLY